MLNFNIMNALVKKTQSSKGERLNWAKVQRVESVKITPASVTGRMLTESEHAKRNRNSKTLLVP
jgi:CRISPR/Cas system CSM-associated protein Csm5 (group 7 of RAMP superfamily)